MRSDKLNPLPHVEGCPSFMLINGRVDVHSLAAEFLADSRAAGAYLNSGLGKGRSAISTLRGHVRERARHRYVFCDSSEGLPELSGLFGADAKSRAQPWVMMNSLLCGGAIFTSWRWALEAVMLFDVWNCFNASNRLGERRG